MSFPRYPEYKDSGVEWLGQVPAHWGAGRLKWMCKRYAGGTPDRANPSFWENGSIPWLNSGAVNDRVITKPSEFITLEGFERSSARWIPAGSLVMALAGQGKTKGMVAQVAFPTTSNQSMAAIVPSASLKARYLFWWLDSNYESIRNMAGGDLRDGLNLELLGNIDCPTPPPAEQQAIADFLDRETAKIDALVAEQERLIELLKEKRQAVISHAVTKGLDPSVPMKYSGVEWIGEIPAHWQVARVKTLSTFTTSGPRGWGERLGTEGALFVQSGDVNDRLSVDYAGCNRVAVDEGAEAARTRVEAGDILVCITGAKTGNVGVCLAPPTAAYVNQHLCLIRPNAEALPGFLGLALKSHVGQLHFALSQYGLKQGLSLEDVRECRATMPPTAEQSTLLTIIAVKTAQLDELCETSERSIALLQERRAALISAAVTGQIDVRGAAA